MKAERFGFDTGHALMNAEAGGGEFGCVCSRDALRQVLDVLWGRVINGQHGQPVTLWLRTTERTIIGMGSS